MKKIILLLTFAGVFLGSIKVDAIEVTRSIEGIPTISSGQKKLSVKWFASKPPKKYKFSGVSKNLVKFLPSKGGYVGYYY